jgi:hypothetical protein
MTELHAFRPVSTAFDKTRKLLLEPFDIGVWIKLVIITFFVGTGVTSFNPGNNLQYTFKQGDIGSLPTYDFGYALSDSTIIALILLVVVAAIVLALIMSYLRGVLSFVLIEALTTGNVRIVQPFKDNMGRGFKVFVFNVIIALVSIIVIGAIVVAMILAILWALGGGDFWSAGTWDAMSAASLFALVIVIVLGLLAMVAFTVLIGLFAGFFYDFGVPLMYFRQMGLRESIGHVWGMVRRQPLEFFVYVIVRWVLEVVIAIVTGIVVLFFMAIFIAIGIITVVAMLKAAETSLLLALPFGLALIIGLLLLLIVAAFISMPVQVYLRYYSLDFLKSFDPSCVNYAGRIADTGAQ